MWSLRDVVFLTPPLSSTPLGSVVKLDGLYAAVLFPSLSPAQADYKEAESEGGEKSVLSQCRLLRKDDLLVSKKRIVWVGIKNLQFYPNLVFKGRNFIIFSSYTVHVGCSFHWYTV